MTSRPRVTASAEYEGITTSAYNGWSTTTPAVHVEVAFDLHDHIAALGELDKAVAKVRAQIKETA